MSTLPYPYSTCAPHTNDHWQGDVHMIRKSTVCRKVG